MQPKSVKQSGSQPVGSTRQGRVDFHLHSYASNVTDYYAANSFAIPESYSKPLVLYRELKQRGMTLVTLTDHNSIDGVKELLDAGLPDVFVSAEMTTTFPEDGCNIHVTVANMTEAQFAEVNRLRGNVYEMIDYVDRQIAAAAADPRANQLAYFMTHPLMSTQNRPYGRKGALTLAHLEKALLLLEMFEVRNGTRTRSLNELTERLITSLDRQTIERLADRHGIAPKGDLPWCKTLLSGSDDHSGINPGQTWTEFDAVGDGPIGPNQLIAAMRARRTRPAGSHGGPVTLAHAMLKLLYDGKQLGPSAGRKTVGMGGAIQSLLRMVFDGKGVPLRQKVAIGARSLLGKPLRRLRGSRSAPPNRSFERILSGEVQTLLADAAFRSRLGAAARTDDKIFTVVSALLNRIFAAYVQRIGSARSLDLVRVVKEVVALVSSNVFVSLPYLLSYLHQSSDRLLVKDVCKEFEFSERQRLVLFTDTFVEINGVARTVRKMIQEAVRRDLDFTVVTCLSTAELADCRRDPELAAMLQSGRLVVFESIVNLDFPEYEGLQVRFPPFLELLKFLQEGGFTKMQISTPGTVGIAGLLASKILQIETSSTYHTCFPEYVESYTKDISLEALAWRYMILFYHSVDEVVVPSKFIARLLHQRGLRKRKLLVLDRWVDLERFHPRKRSASFWPQRGLVGGPGQVNFVYVGRLSAEKDLGLLADAYRRVRQVSPRAHLILIGDGPYRRELERRLAGLPVTLTGFLEGEVLSVALASADAKLFPSTTDTWGNAPLEAQAAGLPVVVSDQGGPQELMVDGVTGFRVAGHDVAQFAAAMLRLLDDDLRTRMGRAAREFTERHRLDEPFLAIFDSARYRKKVKGEADDELEIERGNTEPEIVGVDYEAASARLLGA